LTQEYYTAKFTKTKQLWGFLYLFTILINFLCTIINNIMPNIRLNINNRNMIYTLLKYLNKKAYLSLNWSGSWWYWRYGFSPCGDHRGSNTI